MTIRTLKPGELHHLIQGKQIEYVAKNGSLLVIRCIDGCEVQVAWVDGNGVPFKGEPAIKFSGLHVRAKKATVGARGRSTTK